MAKSSSATAATMLSSILQLLSLLILYPSSNAFVLQQPNTGGSATRLWSASPSLKSDASSSSPGSTLSSSRFVVQNRFRVRKGREAAFEKRWADRESRLGTLDGFRFFCMLRKIDADADDVANGDPNYVSCTVWETLENFEAWRKGDAFKEAHGGGTVGGVVSMLAATARNTYGKPKPCFWKGLLPESIPGNPPDDGEGWRRIDADGKTMLPTDCFVAMNRFSVKPGMESAFERRFAERESTLKDCNGFRGFLLLRRDGGKQPGDGKDPDDGYTHSTFSIWDSRANFDDWMSGQKNKKPSSTPMADNAGVDAKKPPPIYTQPPTPTFYEGILSLESSPGI